MAFTYSFVDSAIYGTDDINDITKSLTGAGVAPFVSKDSYSTSDLNTLTAELVESGVSLDGCRCTVENAGTAEMTVTVAQGIVFFESGVRLTVDGDGYTVSVAPNTAGYVYAYFSPSLQKADIAFASELPSDGEYVVLAEVSASGEVTDKRAFARSKVATMGKNVSLRLPFVAMERELLYSNSLNYCYAVAHIPDVDLSNFNYALLVRGEFSDSTVVAPPLACFYDLTNDKGLFSIYGNYTVRNGNVFEGGNHYIYELQIHNDELCIVATFDKQNVDLGSDFSAYTAIFM